jgi:hypothetical protein
VTKYHTLEKGWRHGRGLPYILTPAYGRDYTSKASAKEGLRSGQDFYLQSPWQCNTSCSIRDFRKGDVLHVRIERHRSIASFTLKEDGKI